MPFHTGDRVRLIKPAPVADTHGPAVGAAGTVLGLAIRGTGDTRNIWRVEFDDLTEQFHERFPIGIWFVDSDEIELIAK